MRKLFAFLLALLLITCVLPTIAEIPVRPLAEKTDEEVKTLYMQVKQEMIARGFEESIFLYRGFYETGIDIEPGMYLLRLISIDDPPYTKGYVYIFPSKEKYINATTKPYLCSKSVNENEGVEITIGYSEPGMISLREGYVMLVTRGAFSIDPVSKITNSN